MGRTKGISTDARPRAAARTPKRTAEHSTSTDETLSSCSCVTEPQYKYTTHIVPAPAQIAITSTPPPVRHHPSIAKMLEEQRLNQDMLKAYKVPDLKEISRYYNLR